MAERVIELAAGTATEYVGGFAEFVVQREERLARLRSLADRQAKEIAHIERFVERFRYKATKARQVQSRIKTLEKLERIEVPDHRAKVARFGFPPPRRSSRLVAELVDVTVGYDGDAGADRRRLRGRAGREAGARRARTARARRRCCGCCWASWHR